MRDPYITVKYSDIVKLLDKETADKLLSISVNLSMLGYESVSKKAISKKLVAIEEVKDDLANLISIALTAYKTNKTHKVTFNTNYSMANEKDKNKAAKGVREFCNSFNLQLNSSSISTYIQIIETIVTEKRMSIASLGNNYEKAHNFYSRYLDVTSMKPEEKNIFETFKEVFERLRGSITKVPINYTVIELSDILYAVRECVKLQTTPDNWMEAQFFMVKAFTSLPTTAMLYGDNAIKRYAEYTAKHKKEVNNNFKSPLSLLSRI